jgi:Histidine kinase-, DNA gyrase B-, and HSP90-like ATPase
MAARQGHEVIPSARRLIRSLRDMGYDFAAAVADLIDNSIEAKATLVAVDIEFDGDDSWVRITDNGRGMATAELKEAMRYGAERDYEDDDLGKFGLGLKTASMSQCQRLSVASRVNKDRADIAAFCWDLDHIDKTNRWEILPLDRNGLGPAIREPLKEKTGTVVLWQRLDRILGFKHPYGEFARKRLLSMCRELEEHLGMVFHRFLAGEARSRRFKILVNGNVVEPWDPYARNEPHTQELQPVTLAVEQDGMVLGEVLIEPFVLPHQDKFSSPLAHGKASGPRKWNRQQGFYIYRANRMIQSGGWSNLRTIDEHLKLARVAISYPPKLDEAFKINVAKMRVQLPQTIREGVEKAIGPVLRIADKTYRTASKKAGGQHGVSSDATTAPGGRQLVPTPPEPSKQAIAGAKQQAARLWTLDQLAEELETAATRKEKPVIQAVLSRVRDQLSNA